MKATDLYQETAKVANELYEKSGKIEGRDLDNWFEAERIVKGELATKEKSGSKKIVSTKRDPSRNTTTKSVTTSGKKKA